MGVDTTGGSGVTGDDVVRAAGGVVWRPAPAGGTRAGVEVVIIRRPRYGDWSLPKGKLDPGETWQQAAVREVVEETGLAVEVGDYLGQVEYLTTGTSSGGTDGRFRRKVVRYWVMVPVAGPAGDAGNGRDPDAEVDEVRWVPAPEAAGELTYEHDRGLVRTFLARQVTT